MKSTLSVCCLTGGRRPALLAGILAMLRDLAEEIVVGVEEPRAAAVSEATAGIADIVNAVPCCRPADRPIAWLFGSCSGTWVFNIDDDEVPSPRVLAALPELMLRTDITHAWFARRWLYPTRHTYLDQPPWSTEFQPRLFLADERFLQFSDVFHRPVVCHGPSVYVSAPLWHLDSVLSPAARRRDKARQYELERPGMRVGGIAHNLGMYLPELLGEPVLAAVPDDDLAAIEGALAYQPSPGDAGSIALGRAAPADVDERWPGPPYAESLYRGEISVMHRPTEMIAGVQYTVDVLVTNGSDRTWHWGMEARPEIRLAYKWSRDGKLIAEAAQLRTSFPADLPPGATQLVPVHVVPPLLPGEYVLEIDLLHEHVRWFGVGASFGVEVARRGRVALLGRAERLPDFLWESHFDPAVEPVVILRDLADRDEYGDFATVDGLRSYLLEGTVSGRRWSTFARLAWRTLKVARFARRGTSPPLCAALLDTSRSTDALFVAGENWAADAAFGREWVVLAATALMWRLARRPVVIADDVLPEGRGVRAASVRWLLRRVRSPER
jgi:hypothetical protein